MFSCISVGKYNMFADFYRQYKVQDGSNQIVRLWGEVDLANPLGPRIPTYRAVPVEARGLGNLRGKDSGTMEVFKDKYNMFDFIRIKTSYAGIHESFRVMNIRNADGVTAWTEEYTGYPTIYDIIGVTPSYDPFGQFIEYEIFCNRAQAQTTNTNAEGDDSTPGQPDDAGLEDTMTWSMS